MTWKLSRIQFPSWFPIFSCNFVYMIITWVGFRIILIFFYAYTPLEMSLNSDRITASIFHDEKGQFSFQTPHEIFMIDGQISLL